MVNKLSSQKYNGSRGKDFLKKIGESLRKIRPDDVTIDHVWETYGLGLKPCGKHVVSNPKSTNCKENPYCLGRLGLEKFEKLIKKSEEIRNDKMTQAEKRDAVVQPCGLTNWANFCYVNSFLQIWFNDPVFRQIIYDWKPSEAYITPIPPAMDVQLVMDALQKLFFTLDTTPYEDADAQEFCTALRLNAEQQDAQEFTVMFFDSIDRNLRKHPNGQMMRDRIAERFNGLQTSVLRCKCSHHSDNTTKFSALNLSIDGHTTLSAAIKGYFADECLSDFACSGCGRRGNVVRETRIDHMPPVLLLSLNRYVYDSNTGRRKKLKTPLQYPRLLNVEGLPHGEKMSEDECKYELSAVMVHEGDSAECGHYWDIIRHPYSGLWYKYNDKIVKETKAPGVETEKAEAAMAKANIDLKYCYGLVYRRKEPAKEPKHPPVEICGKWTKEMEHKFYRMTDTEAQASQLSLDEISARFKVVGEHMSALEVKPDRANQRKAKDITFLPTRLISDILAAEWSRANTVTEQLTNIADELDRSTCEMEDDAAAQESGSELLSSPQKRKKNVRRRVKSMYDKRLEQVEIANTLPLSSLTLCPHERISYESVLSGEAKAVNKQAAEKLIKDYGLAVSTVDGDGVTRIDRLKSGLEVCMDCVRDYTRDVHFKSKLEDDHALSVKIVKEDKTRCSIKAFHAVHRQPPAGTLYVARTALNTFKRDAGRERDRRNHARSLNRQTWMVGAADAVRAAIGGEKRRRKRAGGDEEEETLQPTAKLSRSDVVFNGNGHSEEDGGGRVNGVHDVEEIVRDLLDEVAGPRPSREVNGGAAAATSSSSVIIIEPDESTEEREGAGKEDDDEVEIIEDEEMMERESKGRKTRGGKRTGKEGSSATDESDMPSSPAPYGDKGAEENGRNGNEATSTDEDDNMQPIIFNEQLKCDHDGINISEFRHMVTREEWKRLTRDYFEQTFEVPTSAAVCEECKSFDASAQEDKQMSSMMMKNLSEAVGDILRMMERRVINGVGGEEGEVFTNGVCSIFVEKARKTLNSRGKGRQLPPLCQDCVLCDHAKPRLNTKPMDGGDGTFIVPVTEKEWNRLKREWKKATKEVEGGGGEDTPQSEYADADIILCPITGAVVHQCVACHESLRDTIEEMRYVYDGAYVYVKLQTDEPSTSKGGEKDEKEEKGEKGEGKEGKGSKDGSEENAENLPLQIVTTTSSGRTVIPVGGGRSSTRRGQSKGLIKVKMSSTQTVKELKIALLKHVNYSPVDQLLYSTLGGDPLQDERTLMEARVLPENHDSPIILIVQSASGDGMLSSPTNEKNRAVERGFYDTALAH